MLTDRPAVRRINLVRTPRPLHTAARIRKPLAGVLTALLLFQLTAPALAQDAPAAPAPAPASPTGAAAAELPAPAPGGASEADKPAPSPKDPPPPEALSGGGPTGGPLQGTFSVDAFQTDLFSGAATASIPILVPPGLAGTAPKIALGYSSATVDELGPRDQGQGTGL